MRRNAVAAVVAVVIVVGALAGLYLSNRLGSSPSATSGSTSKVQVVAAENFWGSLVSQLGGTHVNVISIVSDPNADPHSYESNPANARAITDARLVIVNGAGYDTWALNMISAESTQNQRVLNVQQLVHQPVDANPHFWYSPYFVNDTVKAMYDNLVAIDPANAAYYKQQYTTLNASLWSSYMNREAKIKQKFAGSPVAATEDIFTLMANATGLNVISPPGFMKAVAEGNDPSPQDVATFQQLMQTGNSTVRVLVYNAQTVTPLTQSLKALAVQHQIPIIGVTETIQPPDATFQAWMSGELADLQNALNAQALGK